MKIRLLYLVLFLVVLSVVPNQWVHAHNGEHPEYEGFHPKEIYTVGDDDYYKEGDQIELKMLFVETEFRSGLAACGVNEEDEQYVAVQAELNDDEYFHIKWDGKEVYNYDGIRSTMITFHYTVQSDAPEGTVQQIRFDHGMEAPATNGCHPNNDEFDKFDDNDNQIIPHLFTDDIIIDLTAPEIEQMITGSRAEHSDLLIFTAGEEIFINVSFNEEVKVSESVQATLNNGRTAQLAWASEVSAHFSYTIQPGDDIAGLEVTGITGGTITDLAGNPLDRTLPVNGLLTDEDPGKDEEIVIDTSGPVFKDIVVPPGDSYQQVHTVTVNAADRAGLAPEDILLYYKWNTQSAAPASETIDGVGAGLEQPLPNPGTVTGTYYVHLRAVDDVGNETIQTLGPVRFDNEKPMVVFDPSSDESNEQMEVTVTASDYGKSGVEKLSYRWNSGTPVEVQDTGITVSSPLSEGDHTLEVTAWDVAGNKATYTSGAYRMDQTAPTVDFDSEGSAVPAQSHSISYRVEGEPGESGRVYTLWSPSLSPPVEDDEDWELLHDGAFPLDELAVSPAGQNGMWYFYVKTLDQLGNVNIYRTSEGFLLDNEAVELAFTVDGTNGQYVSSATTQLQIDGQIPDFSAYTVSYLVSEDEIPGVDEEDWDASLDGAFTFNEKSGIYYIHVKAADQAGNVKKIRSQPFYLDHLAPSGTVQFVDTHTNEAEASANFAASDAMDTSLELSVALNGGEWSDWLTLIESRSITLNAAEGAQTLSVKYRDSAGNISEVYSDEIIYDITPPQAVDITYSPDSWTKGAVTATVSYEDNFSPAGQTTKVVEQNGTYSVSFSDLAGNTNEAEVTVAHIDKQKPIINFVSNGTVVKQQHVSTAIEASDNVTAADNIPLFYAWSQNANAQPASAEWNAMGADREAELADTDGTWYLWIKAEDEVGNVSFAVSNPYLLDNTAPIGTVSYSTYSRTAMPVIAQLVLNEPGTVTTPAGDVRTYTFEENGSYTFVFEDEAGNIGTATAEVSWIDDSLPIAQVSMSPDQWTNQPVEVTINVEGEPQRSLSHIQAPSNAELLHVTAINEGATVTEAVYKFHENGTLTFTIEDLETGQTNEEEVTVQHIDRTPPTGELLYSHPSWTRDNVTVTLLPQDDRSEVMVIGGEKTVVFTENGSHTFVFVDEAGNESTLTATVDWIVREAPQPAITYSTEDWTQQSVTASVYFSNEGAPVSVLNNDGSLSYMFEDNGTFTFFYEDAAGNEGQVNAQVSWIDREAPTGTLSYSSVGWTNDDVTVTLLTEDNSGLAPIITSEGGEQITFTENGLFTFEWRDAAGNVSQTTAVVDRIDRTPPEADVHYSVTGMTNATVRVSISPNEPVVVLNNGGGTAVDFTDNGTFVFLLQDRAGNTREVTASVDNIDRRAPIANVSYSTEALTKEDVIATVSADEPIYVWNNNRSKERVFRDNGSFTFMIQDLAGNMTEIEATVANIDKTKAQIELSYSETEPTRNDVTVTVQSDRPLTILNNDGKATVTFTHNTIYWLLAEDELQNEYVIPIEVSNIDRTAPTIQFANGEHLLIPVSTEWSPIADVQAIDNIDGDLTSSIVVNHEVDSEQAGAYEIIYRVKDQAGNETVVERKAFVVLTDQLSVYVNTHPTDDGNARVKGSAVSLQLLGVQGDVTVKWTYGRWDQGHFKTGFQTLEGSTLSATNQGYYTFLVQDAERQYHLAHVYVIPDQFTSESGIEVHVNGDF